MLWSEHVLNGSCSEKLRAGVHWRSPLGKQVFWVATCPRMGQHVTTERASFSIAENHWWKNTLKGSRTNNSQRPVWPSWWQRGLARNATCWKNSSSSFDIVVCGVIVMFCLIVAFRMNACCATYAVAWRGTNKAQANVCHLYVSAIVPKKWAALYCICVSIVRPALKQQHALILTDWSWAVHMGSQTDDYKISRIQIEAAQCQSQIECAHNCHTDSFRSTATHVPYRLIRTSDALARICLLRRILNGCHISRRSAYSAVLVLLLLLLLLRL